MFLRSHWRLLTAGLLTTALFTVLVSLKTLGPDYLKNKIVSELQTSCPTCQIKIENLKFNLSSLTIEVFGVEFVSDPTIVTTVSFSAPFVRLEAHPLTLFFGSPSFNQLELSRFSIVVTDDDSKPPNIGPPSYHWVESLPPFSIDEIKITEGEFEYALKTKGKVATIRVHKLDTKVLNFGTREEISSRFIEAGLTGVLEKSGALKLDLMVDLFNEKNEDQIIIDLKEQHLPDMNSFFGVEDGVTLDGELHHALAHLNLSQGHLTGSLELFYKDLELNYAITTERGKFKNFFSNLASSIVIAKRRPDKPDMTAPVVAIDAQRTTNEGLIKFILRGLKDGAMKILTRKDLKEKTSLAR